MTDMKSIQGQVQERMRELEGQIESLSTEFEQLKQIAGMLQSTNGRSVAAPAPARRRSARRPARAGKAPAATTGTTRPKGGNRAQQALALIGARPGLTAADLADSMGMKRNYLYRVLPALEKEGKVTKQGTGYHLAS